MSCRSAALACVFFVVVVLASGCPAPLNFISTGTRYTRGNASVELRGLAWGGGAIAELILDVAEVDSDDPDELELSYHPDGELSALRILFPIPEEERMRCPGAGLSFDCHPLGCDVDPTSALWPGEIAPFSPVWDSEYAGEAEFGPASFHAEADECSFESAWLRWDFDPDSWEERGGHEPAY